jgi:hypothetical protein
MEDIEHETRKQVKKWKFQDCRHGGNDFIPHLATMKPKAAWHSFRPQAQTQKNGSPCGLPFSECDG